MRQNDTYTHTHNDTTANLLETKLQDAVFQNAVAFHSPNERSTGAESLVLQGNRIPKSGGAAANGVSYDA